jgi:hypothetical protein
MIFEVDPLMQQLINTPIDRKNINLAKLVYALRQELDIYCLIAINANNIKKHGVGKNFFNYLRNLAVASITLSICKIYEEEKTNAKGYTKYEVNSICGIINNLCKEFPIISNDLKFKDFIQKYNGPSVSGNPMDMLKLTFDHFRNEYKDDLDRFKKFRDKYAAHSEYGFPGGNLPSYEVMEKLLTFGADFYKLVSETFISDSSVQIIPFDLNVGRTVKSSLKRLFKELGFENIKTEMQ